ncbi:synaptonemal complex protein 1-like [Chanodichthys erythropterus]|uniref:synaptonemal complex protein 1-like n=1 Tax=Chanodichthys erythropterus TaxID=933992 RepID=UPI00351E3A7A
MKHYNCLSTDETFIETTGSTELRFIILGGDEDLMDRACDIILRERAERAESETRHREGHVCGRKISVVKTPSTWMSDVRSWCCFSSGVKSKIKDQMPDYASLVFPGPHAFLLVTGNREVTGREHDLLNTISDVLGKEALDYAIVLNIGRNEPKGISSDWKYMRKVYTLEDNEQSVQSLFIETERNTQSKKPTFFIQSSYENLMKKAFLSWENERYEEIKREMEKTLKEKIAAKEKEHEKEVTELKEKLKVTESNLRKKIADKDEENAQANYRIIKMSVDNNDLMETMANKKKQHEKEMTELKYFFRETENKLKDIDTLKCLMLDTLKSLKTKDSQHEGEPGVSSAHENPLTKELEACKDSETNLTNIFSSIVDKLKNQLDTSRNIYLSMVEENIHLQEQLKIYQLKVKDSELKQKLMEAEEKNTQGIKPVEATLDRILSTDLDKLQGDLDRQDMEEEHKEREQRVTSGYEHESTSPALFEEDKDRPLDEKVEEKKSRKEDSPNSGAFKRRGSIEELPFNMPEGQSGKKDSQPSGSSESG